MKERELGLGVDGPLLALAAASHSGEPAHLDGVRQILGDAGFGVDDLQNTPDVPLKTFILEMKGGKKSLLQNSTNLCKSPQLAILNMKGQNGKTVKTNQLRLNIASCGGKKKSK